MTICQSLIINMNKFVFFFSVLVVFFCIFGIFFTYPKTAIPNKLVIVVSGTGRYFVWFFTVFHCFLTCPKPIISNKLVIVDSRTGESCDCYVVCVGVVAYCHSVLLSTA